MKLKKQIASLAVIGMMSVVAATSAFAAGVGYVNFDTLISSHKDYPKVSAQMQEAIKKPTQNLRKSCQHEDGPGKTRSGKTAEPEHRRIGK